MAENSLGREPLSRRELGKLIEATLGSVVFAPVLRTPEQIILPPPQDYLRIGDVAPDWWGGARKSEIITAYVHADNFTGQVRIYASEPSKAAYVVIVGLDGENNIIRGTQFLRGDAVGFNTSILGIGFPPKTDNPNESSGYLFYYPAEFEYPRLLYLAFNNFSIQTPGTDEFQKVTFEAVSVTDPDKMRILSGTDFENDTIRHYMRIGDRHPITGRPNLLMISHTNVREIVDDLVIPEDPMVGYDPQGGQLYILQKDVGKPSHRFYLWLYNKPWMQNPEEVSGGFNPQKISSGDYHYYGPKEIFPTYRSVGWDEIYPGLERVPDFSLAVNVPNFNFSSWGKKQIAFPTVPAKLQGHFSKPTQINFMYQTPGFRSSFLPSVEGSGKPPVITPPYPPSQP